MVSRLPARLVAFTGLLMASSAALAQDPYSGRYSWHGLYAGVNAGYSWSNASLSNTGTDTGAGGLGSILKGGAAPSTIDPSSRGPAAGLQAGYNLQLGSIVVGAEADIHWMGRSNTIATTPTAVGFVPVTTTASQNIDRLYTLRGRAGVTITPQILLYGTGGLAVATGGTALSVAAPAAGPPLAAGSRTGFNTGWVAGFGAEYAVTRTISLKAEYLHYDLGARETTLSYTYGLNQSSLTARWRDTGDLAHIGLNYRF